MASSVDSDLQGFAHAHLVGQDAATHRGLFLRHGPCQKLPLIRQKRHHNVFRLVHGRHDLQMMAHDV
jgi:hypothetical protein